MNILDAVARKLQSMSTHGKVVLALFLVIAVMEFVVARLWPKSAVVARWKAGVEALAAFWTAIILAVVYFLSVSVVSLGLKLSGKDPLDRSLARDTIRWQPHEPNPLGPEAAARHQF